MSINASFWTTEDHLSPDVSNNFLNSKNATNESSKSSNILQDPGNKPKIYEISLVIYDYRVAV